MSGCLIHERVIVSVSPRTILLYDLWAALSSCMFTPITTEHEGGVPGCRSAFTLDQRYIEAGEVAEFGHEIVDDY